MSGSPSTRPRAGRKEGTMGRYEESTTESTMSDAVITCGLSLLLGTPPDYETRITDTVTGKTGEGYGSTAKESRARAWENLKEE